MGTSISEIKKELQALSFEELEGFISSYSKDERTGVKSLVKKAEKQIEDRKKELCRLDKMKSYEKEYIGKYQFICGVDEAGRGPFAGPIVAGAAILSLDTNILYLNDSKKLSPARRDELFDEIKEKAIAWGIGIVSPKRIDEIGV
ncbi:MAG: ribonuclease HII, partial [Lachnospiraceae bacterium]|nr:ribonuclease HII [Lachnospiraceae bacterium]